MKRKSAIIIAILIMCVGFAAISTTLIINGNAKVSENTDDFSVIFTAASLDGADVYANVISQDKKTITFETSDLKSLNQTSVLNYEVTNNSANYDAEVTVNCKVKDGTTAKYTSITNELEGNATKVLAKTSLNGTLTVTLNKVATEEVREKYVCELTFNAEERDDLGQLMPTEWKYNYTGNTQKFTVPKTGNYKIELWGAQGCNDSETGYGYNYVCGKGAYTSGIINLKKGTDIYIYVGSAGTSTSSYNGGGIGFTTSVRYGGGATDIRYFESTPTEDDLGEKSDIGLRSRIMVAGAGGGSVNKYQTVVGDAGGISANNAYQTDYINNSAMGGTQTSGGTVNNHNATAKQATAGTFGLGGNGGGITTSCTSCTNGSFGGGAGYYGGAGGSNLMSGSFPSAGGSSFISGHTGCVALKSSESNDPLTNCFSGTSDIACSYHYSGYKFTDTIMIDGTGCKWTNEKTNQCDGMPSHDETTTIVGNSGNGYARITLIK